MTDRMKFFSLEPAGEVGQVLNYDFQTFCSYLPSLFGFS